MKLTHNQQKYLTYITQHPFCTVADVLRETRGKVKGYLYSSVYRLEKRGLIVVERTPNRHTRVFTNYLFVNTIEERVGN